MTCSTNPLFSMQPLFNQNILSDTQLQDEIAKTFLYTGASSRMNVVAQQRSEAANMSKILSEALDADCDPLPLGAKHQLDDYPSKPANAKKQRIESSSSIAALGHAHADDPNIPPSTEGISTFHDADVLSGRGGGTNVHPGNRTFRDLINTHRREYLKAKKNDKPAISRAIVKLVRDTGGRFLKKDNKSGLWFEIGDTLAREKTSQALRQRAPEMRRLMLQSEQDQVASRTLSSSQAAAQNQQLQQMILQRQMLQNNFNPLNCNMNLLSGLQNNVHMDQSSFNLRVSQMHKKLQAESEAVGLQSHFFKEL